MIDFRSLSRFTYAVAAIVLLLLLSILYYWFLFDRSPEPATPDMQPTVVTDSETDTATPKRTEFTNTKPTGFPEEIPVEEGVVFEQSYGLDYSGQEQLTIYFASQKTLSENFQLYTDFFGNNGWATMNSHQSDAIGAVYATKGGMSVNVVISLQTGSGDTASEVSITALKRI